MKKSFAAMVAMLLCAALLFGCAGAQTPAKTQTLAQTQEGVQPQETEKRRTVPFAEMEYVRPDVARLTETLSEAAEEIEGGCGQSRAEELMSLCFEEFEKFMTAYKLAMIRAYQNTRDEYYREEFDWCAENLSGAEQAMSELHHACAGAEYAQALGLTEDDFAMYGESALSDETAALRQRESILAAEYTEMMQTAVIELDGETVDYNSYMMTAQGEEKDRATLEYYRQYNERAAEIYIELIKLRNDIAQSQGYDSYETMMYGPEGFDRDYSPQDAEKLLEDIRRYIAPMLSDESVTAAFFSEPFRQTDSEGLINALEPTVRSMGGSIEEAFDFMREYGLYDLERREAKADMGFTAYLDAYDAPYLFLQTNGDLSDLVELAHELGHFTDFYIKRNAYESLDLTEFFSQGMEYLLLGRLGDEIAESQKEAIYKNKMMFTILLYTYQGAYAEFEHRVYGAEEDELTAEYLNAVALSLAKEFGFYSEEREEFCTLDWIEISHLFTQPFYVISYPVSNDVAMQIFEMELAQRGSGLEKYMEMLPRDTAYIMEAVEQAGLESPFAEGRMEKTAQTIREGLSR